MVHEVDNELLTVWHVARRCYKLVPCLEKDWHTCRQEAQKVKVPEEIINLLSDVRTYLQDKCEPPVYVSDRRLVKAVAIMQVRQQ